jgi:TATA-box binding protein (TBP) (component of TFIID and TFIIIB)
MSGNPYRADGGCKNDDGPSLMITGLKNETDSIDIVGKPHFAMATDVTFTTPNMTISPIRISTMVTTAHVGCILNLDNLFEQLRPIPYWDLTDGVLKMEYGDKKKGISWKDLVQKSGGAEEKKTFFFNQATLVVRREIAPLTWKEINIKLFRNGGVQMTGVRSEAMSVDALQWLVGHIQATYVSKPVFMESVNIHKMQIQLVNTDFSIGAKIRRENLHKVLSERYRLTVSYEPSIYQGVKTKYFYNQQRPDGCPPGLCPCEKLCKGTGNGMTLGECKKITISPFQTGQIIITGARTMEQIEEAYAFMKEVFEKHADEVLRKNYICPVADEAGANATLALALAPAPAQTKKSAAAGWIHHPSPRNILQVPLDRIQGPEVAAAASN